MISVELTSQDKMIGKIHDIEYDAKTGMIRNSTLRHEEHVEYDDILIKVARDNLNGLQDLYGAGLVHRLKGIGTLLSMYETAGDMKGPAVDMDAMTPGQYDRMEFGLKGVPIPIFHSRWYINARQLESSRERGESLPVLQAETQARLMMESLESTLFNGIDDLTVDGRRVEGYTSHPHRAVVELPRKSWGVDDGVEGVADTLNGPAIIRDIKGLVDMQNQKNRRGPFTLYVSQNIWLNLALDYSEKKGTQTILARMMEFPSIAAIKPSTYMADDNLVLIHLTRDTVDLALAKDTSNVEIMNGNPLQTEFMMYTVLAPRVKSDHKNENAIVHASLSAKAA